MIEQYSAPTSIEEATRVMHEGNVTVLAGGTDLMPQTTSANRQFATTLLNIRRIDGMSEIRVQNGRVHIGALTTVTEILDHEKLARIVPVLAQTADRFASSQLRNAATIGGNLCNASTAGDLIFPLLLLDGHTFSLDGIVQFKSALFQPVYFLLLIVPKLPFRDFPVSVQTANLLLYLELGPPFGFKSLPFQIIQDAPVLDLYLSLQAEIG